MSEASPFASLQPRLLARKGGARPAMRGSLTADFDSLAYSQSALGWNDDGQRQARIIPIDRKQRQQEREQEQEPGNDSRRAAFTLRLDADRHLRLRLASTLQDCSAQALVTEALDRFLDEIPHLEAMVAHSGRADKQA